MTTMGDVADPAECWFCGGIEIEWTEGGWFDCRQCSASSRYNRRLGMVDQTEYPEDLDKISELLHKLRDPSWDG